MIQIRSFRRAAAASLFALLFLACCLLRLPERRPAAVPPAPSLAFVFHRRSGPPQALRGDTLGDCRVSCGPCHDRDDGLMCVHILVSNSGTRPLDLRALRISCESGRHALAGSVPSGTVTMLLPGQRTLLRALFEAPVGSDDLTITIQNAASDNQNGPPH